MLRPLRSPWLGAIVMILVLEAAASAQPTTPTAPTTGSTKSTTTGSGELFGFSLFSSDQDAEFLTTAEAVVKEIGQIVPLSAEEETILVFFIYEIEKLNAIMSLFSGGGTTTTSPGGP